MAERKPLSDYTDDELEREYMSGHWTEAQVGSTEQTRDRMKEIEAEIDRRMPAYGERGQD